MIKQKKMKNLSILSILFLCLFIEINAQTYVKFNENGLLNNASAFGPVFFSPLDKGKANDALKLAISLDIPKRHINGYCEVRAEFLCKKLGPMVYGPNCEIGKIWAFASSISTLVFNKKLSSKNPLFKNENIEWDYHVAPALAIRDGNKIDTVVIDFSIIDKAFIPYRDWLARLNCKEAIYTFTDDFYYLFNTLEGLKLTGAGYNNAIMPTNLPKIITGHFWSLSKSDTITLPSGLAYNDLAIHLVDTYYSNLNYSQYQNQIKSATGLNELKKIIDGTIMGLPIALIDECKKFYIDRLAHWTKVNEI